MKDIVGFPNDGDVAGRFDSMTEIGFGWDLSEHDRRRRPERMVNLRLPAVNNGEGGATRVFFGNEDGE